VRVRTTCKAAATIVVAAIVVDAHTSAGVRDHEGTTVAEALNLVKRFGHDPACYKTTVDARAPSLLGESVTFDQENVLLVPGEQCSTEYPLRVFLTPTVVTPRADWDLHLRSASQEQLRVLTRAHVIASVEWSLHPPFAETVFKVSEINDAYYVSMCSRTSIDMIRAGWLVSGGERVVVLRRSDLALLNKYETE
jgi:hypothetical protein